MGINVRWEFENDSSKSLDVQKIRQVEQKKYISIDRAVVPKLWVSWAQC